jgi:DNA replication protein DnaC
MAAAAEAPEILLGRHLKKLKLPTVLRDCEKPAHRYAAENVDHVRHLARLIELELPDREARMIDRRIRQATFPAIKSLETSDFDAIPALNKKLVLDLARCEFVDCRENIIMLEACLRHDALGPAGVGKTHIAIGLGLAACQRGVKTRLASAAAIVRELIEARDEKRLLRLQQTDGDYRAADHSRAGLRPLSKTGADLLFELISQRYERGATIITSNLPFDEWNAIFGDERLTGALLDRLTRHVHILEMNGSYRLAQSRSRRSS